MKKISFFLILLILLVLTSCDPADSSTAPALPPETQDSPATETPLPIAAPISCNEADAANCGIKEFSGCFWNLGLSACTEFDLQFTEANGIITELVFSFHDMYSEGWMNVLALIAVNIPTARIHVMANGGESNSHIPELERLLDYYGAKNEIIIYSIPLVYNEKEDGYLRISRWPRDHFMRYLVYDATTYKHIKTKTICNPKNRYYSCSATLPLLNQYLMSEKIDIEYLPTDIINPGGNILFTNRHAVVGEYVYVDNEGYSESIIEAFSTMFEDKDIEILSDVPDLFKHIDVKAAYVGHNRFVVGDIEMAVRIINEDTDPKEIEEWEDRMKEEYRLFPFIQTLTELSMEYDVNLDDFANDIAALGYKVIRIPYLPNLYNLENEQNIRTPGLIYPNVIVMVDEENPIDDPTFKPRVLMPTYGLKSLDEAAKRVYENLGFEVREIPSVLPSIYNGAIHCLTNDIVRDISPSQDLINKYSQQAPDPALIQQQLEKQKGKYVYSPIDDRMNLYGQENMVLV
ncbi:MAG: hypothetical protein KKF44_03130 [Nanoarchaeota archaeon]|nr:hypothetical protein [Nanoarchaeota archaeon]